MFNDLKYGDGGKEHSVEKEYQNSRGRKMEVQGTIRKYEAIYWTINEESGGRQNRMSDLRGIMVIFCPLYP